MSVSDWFTIISILTAFLGFLIQNELKLFLAKLCLIEKIVIGYLLLIQIPVLLFYYELCNDLNFLKHPPFLFENGIAPSNIAFILVLSFILYILNRLYLLIPKKKMSESIYSIYASIQEQNQAILPDLIKKYESVDFINSNWSKYEAMFDDEMILKTLVDKYPNLLLSIWHNYNHLNIFQKIFRLFLENPNSAYYSEIKEHWNSYNLLDDKPFLNTIIKDNLTQSINNGILMVFTDHVSKHLLSEYGKASIYNQEHYQPRTRESEGFELSMYYHICFIGLIYSSAIKNRIDISVISHRYTNIQSIYSNMVGQMINNIILIEENFGKEIPSNYHWLIGKIFDWQSNWLNSFGVEGHEEERCFDASSSYISFIPFSMSLCLSELYKGLKMKKITIEFLNQKIYYNILLHYFDPGLHDVMKESIENKIIQGIPNELLEPILDFTLDQECAIKLDDLISHQFGLTCNHKREILFRLLKFLSDNNKIRTPDPSP